MTTVISVENLSKTYRLGQIGTGTFTHDLAVWWAKVRGRPNPLLKIGETDHGNRDGEELWALKDVSFEVKQGEVLGIIGRNGAGKSTLLKILSRVTAPTSGKIKVKGRVASLLEVGTGFHPELTGRENIYLNGAILGMGRKEISRKFDEIVSFAGVEKFIDTPVKRYSSGMYVRLAFAVAAHLEPEILVVDEVLAVGDAEFQQKCLGKMGDVAREGRAVLFVSHNMASIQQLCNKGIIIKKGEVYFIGETSEAIAEYLMHPSNPSRILSERDNHIGSGDIRVVAVEIRSLAGDPLEFVGIGQSFDIFLHFDADEEYLLSRVNFGIDFYSSLGQRIFIQSMEYSGFYQKGKLPLKGIVVCRIEAIPLAKGKYPVTTVVRLDKARVDVVENAFELKIIESNYLNSTISLSSSDVVCLVRGKWRLEKN